MTPERYEQVRNIFVDICELDESRRTEALHARCASDPELRREVESLLAEERNGKDDPLRESRLGIMADVMHAVSEGDGETLKTLGKYRVGRKIGSGGMGAVYEAEQDHPRRTVALKVMRPGMARDDMLKRFAHEAHVLGLLQHPGIAQIYDAGTAETSGGVQPFFVMELVRGEALTSYAQSRNLSTRSRLEIMAQVAEAVHHAHTKGVVHRDLKPGNILVVEGNGEDGSAKHVQPKILDFGVARATDSDVMTTTLHTNVGQLIGTVPYMSPEQASGDTDQIDTRSDVYSLGVVCYELLAHRLPHDLQHMKVHDAARMIREDDPVKLSSINRTFRGDVETIIGKALEKDKERRYQSAADFAADIRRYLNDEPVQARPASAMYQVRKFAQRNKALVGGAIAVVSALMAGIATTTYWLLEALEQRNSAQRASDLADDRLHAADDARADAHQGLLRAEAIQNFLLRTLLAASPENTRGRAVTIQQALDRAEELIATDLVGQPEVEAAVRHTLASLYHELSEYHSAEEHARLALDWRTKNLGRNHVDTLLTMNVLGTILLESGRVDEAAPLIMEAYEGRRGMLGDVHADTLASLNNLAGLRVQQGQLEEALGLQVELLDRSRQLLGPDHAKTLVVMMNLGALHRRLHQLDEAQRILGETFDQQDHLLGRDHPDTLATMCNLAMVLKERGLVDEAKNMYSEALASSSHVHGDAHRTTTTIMKNLFVILRDTGEAEQAIALLRRVLPALTALQGADAFDTVMMQSNLAKLLHKSGRLDEALPLYQQTVASLQRDFPNERQRIAAIECGLGDCLADLREFAEGERHLLNSLNTISSLLGPENEQTLAVCRYLVDLYDAWAKPDEAAKYRAMLPPIPTASNP